MDEHIKIDKYNTKPLTKEMLEEIIEDLQAFDLNKSEDVSHRNEIGIPDEIKAFDDYIKEGFLYMIRNESGVCYGGAGFIREVYNKHKEHGLHDFWFYRDVFVTEDDGLKFSSRWYSVLQVTWTPAPKTVNPETIED